MLSWIIDNLLIYAEVLYVSNFNGIWKISNILCIYISAKVSIWDMVVKLCAMPLYCICESTCNVSMQSTINDRERVRIHLHREVYHTNSLQETYECLPLCILMIII